MTSPAHPAGGPGDVDHVLLTRFNLPSVGAESYIRAAEGWLRERVELFERYCLPSVRNQTMTERLAWLVYLDPESPTWLKAKAEKWAASSPLEPTYRTEVPRETLVADLRRVTHGSGRMLVTTNLDNDDGLAADFYREVAAYLDHETRDVVTTALADTAKSQFVVDRVREAIAEDHRVGGRLALWGRRIMGEALVQAQRVASERDAMTALLAGGVDRPSLDLAAIGRMFTRLTERHAERMEELGLEA